MVDIVDDRSVNLSVDSGWLNILDGLMDRQRSNFFQLVCRTCRAIHTYFELKYDHALDIHDN